MRTPVHFTFAGQEQWWRHADEATADLTSRLWAAPRTCHRSAPAFLEECLLTRDAAVQASGARPGAPVTELACQSAVR
ncbi:hypothetical protein [Streptomyces cyanogenus]|uniref:hypothetical protein n=1 Tax=Streptomyces cyanogenus TaxID=80860 RepID=UPI001AA12558|nr:hypothetical protein [Streptomyces cyanogenus]